MLAFFSVLYLFAFAAQATVVPWTLTDHSNGIEVYERPVVDSPIIEFRGVGLIPATIDKVLSILTDETRATEWADGLAQAIRLETISPFEWIEYNHFNTPFVIKDRDIVNRVTVAIDRTKRTAVVIQKSVQTPLKPETHFVRADLIHAEFRLSVRDTHTLFDGEIRIDPKGSMPKWLFNLFQRSWPKTTFESVRKQAEKKDIVINPLYKGL